MKKEVKRAIVLVVIIVAIVLVIKLIQGFDTTKKELKKKGYTKEEITTIVDKISKDDITKLLEMDKQDRLSEIVSATYYIPDKLFTYLNNNRPSQEVDKVISLVNTGSYQDFYKDVKATDTSKKNAMLVNKYNYLTDSFSPTELVKIPTVYAYEGHSIEKEVYDQYLKMWKAAKAENLTLIVNSSYRTYGQQEKEYNASNDDYAAKPGYSEHQSGLALDIVTYDTIGNKFEESKEFAWLQSNAHLYGFILRYPKDKEDITGYHYESWHYRYLGTELATKVHESDLTYDEYFAYYCDYKKEC